MTPVAAQAAIAVPRGATMVLGALLGGYLLGSLPVAWLLVRRADRQRPERALSLRRATGRRPGTLDAFAAAGVGAAVTVVALELIKGAAAGLGARLYDDAAWFTALAIAGCVAGDAFPIGIRRGRRGVVPLLSGAFAALPGTWAVGVVVAIPALLALLVAGIGSEALLAITIPLAFVLGTHDLRTLPAALLIVVAIVARARLRRLARQRAVAEWRGRGGPGPPAVLDAEPVRRHPRVIDI